MASTFLNFVAQIPGAQETGLYDFAAALLDTPETPLTPADEKTIIQRAAELASLRKDFSRQGGSRKPAYWAHLAGKLEDYSLLSRITGADGKTATVPSSFPTLQIPKDFDTTSQRLTGDMAAAYKRAGLVNRAHPDHMADMGQFIKTLINHIKDDLPPEEAQKLQNLSFKQYKGKLKKPSEVILAGWPKDLYKLYKVVENLAPDQKVKVANKILDFTTQYFGLDFEAYRNDVPTYELKPFDFKDFTFDVFVNGTVKKGHVFPSLTLNELYQATKNKEVILSPQGTLVLNIFELIYPHTATLKDVFDNLKRVHIDESLKAKNNPTLVGDGISGEQGAHFVSSLFARDFNIVAPDITRDASMVTGALRYLRMLASREHRHDSKTSDVYLKAGQFFAGAADIGQPLSFAHTVGQVLNGGAIYLSLAYAPRIEIPLIVGGYLAAKALGHKTLGILRLQSPTTMQPRKNDLTPEQGFAYAYGQWMKELAALVEANNGKHTSIDTWPIVRTFSVEQNPNFKKLIEHVNADPDYGIHFAMPQEAGEKMELPLKQLIAEIRRNAKNTYKLVLSVDRSEGLRTHNNRTMTIIFKAMTSMFFSRVPIIAKEMATMLFSRSPKPEKTKQMTLRDLKKAIGKSSGLLAEALGKKGAKTLLVKGVDVQAETARKADWKKRVGMRIGELQAGSFPLLALEDIRRRNPERCQYYFKKDDAGQLIEAGLFEQTSGARVGYRLNGAQIEMFIKPPQNHRGGEIVFPYSFEPVRSKTKDALVAQVPDQVTPNRRTQYGLDVYAYDNPYIKRASSELGLVTDRSVTAPSQSLVGGILRILSNPEQGIDLSAVTIDRLQFKGHLPEGVTHTFQSFSIDNVYSAEKKDGVKGQIVEGKITISPTDHNGRVTPPLEVLASIFVKGNKTEGELIQIPQPKPLQLNANGISTSLTVLSKELWQKFVDLGGDPNLIHTFDVAASAGGAKGTFAPGFGIAAQIETLLRRKFAGSLVENLALSFLGKMGPGMTYDVRINPNSNSEANFNLQVIKKGKRSENKPDEVLVDGSFDLIAEGIESDDLNKVEVPDPVLSTNAMGALGLGMPPMGGNLTLLPQGIPLVPL